MADNNTRQSRRQTRKEYLLTRKQQQQFRQVRLALFALGGFIALILVAGFVVEYIIRPGQPVATIEDTSISVREFKDRVSLERVQTLSSLDALYEAVGGDVNQLSQFAGAQLNALANPAALGDQVLFQMIDEELIRQEAEARNITVSDAEVDTAIEEQFNFYGGELPPDDDADAGPEPTPTITPISAEAAEPEAEAEPTEPAPTQTPVSREAFDEQYQEQLTEFVDAGGSEEAFRERIYINLLSDKLRDAFADEQGIETEELQVSLFYIAFQDAEQADATLAEINGGKEYLTAWNEIRSAERVTATQPFASEFQWTAPSNISSSLGADIAAVVETLPLNQPSDVIVGNGNRSYIVEVRGREDRELSEGRINAQKSELLQEWLTEAEDNVQIFERWQNDIPDRPILDPKYYTPVEQPVIPEIDTGGAADQ